MHSWQAYWKAHKYAGYFVKLHNIQAPFFLILLVVLRWLFE